MVYIGEGTEGAVVGHFSSPSPPNLTEPRGVVGFLGVFLMLTGRW
jgi:hypothetical protein